MRSDFDFDILPLLQPSIALGGALPFGAAFVELYFMLTSLFGHRA